MSLGFLSLRRLFFLAPSLSLSLRRFLISLNSCQLRKIPVKLREKWIFLLPEIVRECVHSKATNESFRGAILYCVSPWDVQVCGKYYSYVISRASYSSVMTNWHRQTLIPIVAKIHSVTPPNGALFATVTARRKIYKRCTERGKIFLPHSFIALRRRREIKWNLRSLKRISTHVKPRQTVYEWIPFESERSFVKDSVCQPCLPQLARSHPLK